MGEAEARAVGAGNYIEVEGEQFQLAPLSMKTLMEVQREAVRSFKEEAIKTYSLAVENGMMSAEKGLAKLDEIVKWTIDDLPRKKVHDCSTMPVTREVRRLVRSEFPDLDLKGAKEVRYRVLVTQLLDGERIKPEQVQKAASMAKPPQVVESTYDTWWITGCYEGQVTFLWASVSQNHPLTREEVAAWPLVAIMEGARRVEAMTTPDLGNT